MKYRIEGATLPVVICELESGETMITESGAMAWMSPNMKMETTSNGGIGKRLKAINPRLNMAAICKNDARPIKNADPEDVITIMQQINRNTNEAIRFARGPARAVIAIYALKFSGGVGYLSGLFTRSQ